MENPIAIRQIAALRLAEARVLAANGQPEGAFYLAGYAVELTLKARIAESLELPWLFDEAGTPPADKFNGLSELRSLLKTHKLLLLLAVAGLKPAYERQMIGFKNFFKYKTVLESWNESVRYQLPGTVDNLETQKFLEFLTNANGFLQWIEKS